MPAPDPINPPTKRRERDGGSNQNLILFIRGNAISGAPIIKGTSQLPKPPIMMGITIKKIIIKAWAVTITLYNWSSIMNLPGWANSLRINILSLLPRRAPQPPKMKYIVPMSLWLVE